MEISFLLIQLLNGIQYGLLLFLISSGLTIIFGIMGVINLAHGSFYMIGAYIAFSLTKFFGTIFLAIPVGLVIMVIIGLLVEWLFISRLYKKDHLQQVLLTFGLILIFNELQSILWGNDPHGVPIPQILAGSLRLTETLNYPIYRIFISVTCLGVAVAMYLLIQKTPLGQRIRAGSIDQEMIANLGINLRILFAAVFSIGVTLAGLAGMIAAPVESIYPGIGEQILIVSFVVVVIGGIGSIKGAFVGAIAIGLADVFGQVFLPDLASVVVYAVMAAVLLWKPAGLFGRNV